MPAKLHHVVLTPEQRQKVEVISRSFKRSERERKRARILLLADANREERACKDDEIHQQLGVSTVTVEAVRRRSAQEGLETALFHKQQQNRKARRLDGAAEAFLIATVCSAPPHGHKRWTMRLLNPSHGLPGCFAHLSRKPV